MDREKMIQFQMIEQEATQLNQQSEMIDQNLKEMNDLKDSLIELEKKESKEMLDVSILEIKNRLLNVA